MKLNTETLRQQIGDTNLAQLTAANLIETRRDERGVLNHKTVWTTKPPSSWPAWARGVWALRRD